MKKNKPITDAVRILFRRYIKGDPEPEADLQDAREELDRKEQEGVILIPISFSKSLDVPRDEEALIKFYDEWLLKRMLWSGKIMEQMIARDEKLKKKKDA